MSRSSTAAVAALTLGLAIPIGGCGEDDSDQFREAYNAAIARLGKVNAEIGHATGGRAAQSNDAIARDFRGIAELAERARARLSKLDPPDDAEAEYDQLLAALEREVADLKAVARAAKRSDARATRAAVRSLARNGRRIAAAQESLKRAVDG